MTLFLLASPPPKQLGESEAGSSKMVSTRQGPKSAVGRNHFETVFAEAMEGGNMEVSEPTAAAAAVAAWASCSREREL